MRCKAVRSTAYSQVVGPTIIHQINTANNLANFLSDKRCVPAHGGLRLRSTLSKFAVYAHSSASAILLMRRKTQHQPYSHLQYPKQRAPRSTLRSLRRSLSLYGALDVASPSRTQRPQHARSTFGAMCGTPPWLRCGCCGIHRQGSESTIHFAKQSQDRVGIIGLAWCREQRQQRTGRVALCLLAGAAADHRGKDFESTAMV